jgi:hypothetical protein
MVSLRQRFSFLYFPILNIYASISQYMLSSYADATILGRDDYLVVHGNGDVNAWRNAGNADKPAFWEDLGVVFKGNGSIDIESVRFLDVHTLPLKVVAHVCSLIEVDQR